MTTPRAPHLRADWGPGAFPNDVARQVASAIVGGAPFASTLTRDVAVRGGAKAYPIVNAITGQAWIAEGEPIPDVEIDSETLVVAVCKLAGIVLVSNESVEDPEFALLAEVDRILRDAFSRDLDDALINGDAANTPTGVLSVASSVTGATLVQALAAAVGEIGEAGGRANFVALSPSMAAAEIIGADAGGEVFWQTVLDYLGLQNVLVPGLATPLAYDASQMFLLTSRDWQVDVSRDYAPAYRTDSTALRVSGRFALAVPTPQRSVRVLQVGDDS